MYQVQFAQHFPGLEHIRQKRAEHLAESSQDSHDFSFFGILQLPDFVVGVKHFGRFDVHGLPGGRGVVNKSLQLAFVGCPHRYHHSAISDGGFNIAVGPTFTFGLSQQLPDFSVYRTQLPPYILPNACQCLGCPVGNLATIIHNAVHFAQNKLVDAECSNHIAQGLKIAAGLTF